jgi:hypothetical protein
VLTVWVFLPEDNSDWKPYSLVIDEEIAALEAKRAIPDEDNAATIYNQLFKKDEIDFHPEFLTDELDSMASSEPWSSKDYPEFAAWLDSLEEPFELLKQATKKQQCVFPIEKFDFLDQTSRHSAFKRWAQMLVKAINNDLGDNNIDGALDKTAVLMKMAQHQCQQISLLDLLVGISIEAFAEREASLITVGYELSDKQLDEIDNLLVMIEHDWQRDIRNVVLYENLFAMKFFLGVLYESNSFGQTRITHNPMSAIKKSLGEFENEMPEITYWYLRIFKINAIKDWFWLPRSPQSAIVIFEEVYNNQHEMAKADYDWNRGPDCISWKERQLNYRGLVTMLNGISTGPYKRIHELYMRVTSNQQAGHLIVGLRRYKDVHGDWPDGLDQIRGLVDDELFVDPVNGGGYGYELTDDGFAIYTKGENGIDEGGVIGKKKEDGSKTDDFTFWPGKRT